MMPGLTRDEWSLTRRVETPDDDGIVRTVDSVVAIGLGAFGYSRVGETAIAGQQAQEVVATLSTHAHPATFRQGDHLTVRGQIFRVVAIKNPRSFGARVLLALLDGPGA